MIDQQNGLEEILQLFDSQILSSGGEPMDFEKGILQAIGYKEFYPLYQLMKVGEDFDFQRALGEGKTRLLNKTMDYTKYQIKWL